MKVGIFLVLAAIFYGFALGGVFGAAEDSIKDHLQTEGRAVFETVYLNDEAKLKATLSKSWTYFKRAHLHANAIGTASLSMILLLACVGEAKRIEKVTSLLLGVGSLGYSSFWMWAGLAAPGLGGTGAAKASLEWLAVPTAGACLVGVLLVGFVFVRAVVTAGGNSKASS